MKFYYDKATSNSIRRWEVYCEDPIVRYIFTGEEWQAQMLCEAINFWLSNASTGDLDFYMKKMLGLA